LGNTSVFIKSVPPSTPQASFCVPTHPARLLFLDIETFYPWGSEYPQPQTAEPGKLLRRQNRGQGHPWAADPRRCAIRFLTVHDTLGTFGPESLTIDLQTSELPMHVREALFDCTLVGHNLDFDLTVLRALWDHSLFSVIDTMIASRLLGLGKEKFRVPDEAYCDLDSEELEAIPEADPNPIDHSLAATVKRYLGIRMDKTSTKLGESDWSRIDISSVQYAYMAEDVRHLPALWEAIKIELQAADLDGPFQ
jgi:3'-5' exonuclease